MPTVRTIRLRQGSLFAAFLALLGLLVLAGILQGAQSSRAAAPAVAPTTCTSLRQWYIGPNGEPYLLPWCGEAPGQASAVYPGRWLRGPKLDVAGVTAPVPTSSTSSSSTTSTASSTSSSSTAAATGELAPALSLDGVPAVTAAAGRVDVVWTPAKAPGGSAVAFYVVQGRASGEAAWTQRGGSTTATHATVAGLTVGADSLLRVQAVYGNGDRGPWSNTVTVSVPAS